MVNVMYYILTGTGKEVVSTAVHIPRVLRSHRHMEMARSLLQDVDTFLLMCILLPFATISIPTPRLRARELVSLAMLKTR